MKRLATIASGMDKFLFSFLRGHTIYVSYIPEDNDEYCTQVLNAYCKLYEESANLSYTLGTPRNPYFYIVLSPKYSLSSIVTLFYIYVLYFLYIYTYIRP